MMEIGFLQLAPRLARTVLRLSAGDEPDAARPVSRLSSSQSELANMVGSSRENVNRCLRNWQKGGLIDLADGWLIILEREGLRRIAEAD